MPQMSAIYTKIFARDFDWKSGPAGDDHGFGGEE
jgi:hypothetical protein